MPIARHYMRAIHMGSLWVLLTGAGLVGAGSLSEPALCDAIGKKLHSVPAASCRELQLTVSDGVSVEGRPILVKEYPPLARRAPQARALLVGGIHGDEYSSVSIVFKWMEILRQHHTGLFHWRVVPLLNPDGLLRGDSTRTNARGVDLNRNFLTADWERDSRDYWVRKTGSDPRRFPGTAPQSEPETVWITREIAQFKPDVIISVHAPYGVLDFDGPPAVKPRRFGSLILSLLGTYPGSMGRYGYVEKGIPVITIELDNARVMPPPSDVRQIWQDLVSWLRSNIHGGERKSHG